MAEKKKKKSGEKSVGLLSLIATPFYKYYKFFNLNNTIAIKKIEEGRVHIFGQPSDKEILYVLKLETNNNYFEKIGLNELKSTLRHSENASFVYFFIRNPNFQAGYIATFSRELAFSISDKTGIPILGPIDTIQFLFDIYKVTNYKIDKDSMTVVPSISAKREDLKKIIDPMMYNVSTILKEGAYKIDKDYKLFQIVKYTNKKSFNYIDNFRKDFDGIFSMYVDLSDNATNFIINESLRYAKMFDKEKVEDFETLLEENQNGRLNTAVVNGIILSKTEREANYTAGSLGLELVEKNLEKSEIIAKTLIKTREMDYDALVPLDYLDNIIGIRTKKLLNKADIKRLSQDKSWVDVKVDFYGRDLFNAPTNFCFRANENPHAVLIADAGTGKSVTVQKILTSILRYDMEKDEIKRFKDVKTRYYEIGGSSAKLLRSIKEIYPNDVGMINGTLDGMRFSVTDIEVIGEKEGKTIVDIPNPILDVDSLATASGLISVILEETGETPLSSSEEAVFVDVIKDIYMNKKYKCKTLQELKDISQTAYNDIIKEALKKGYSMSTRTDEIRGINGIGKLQKPVLEDVMKEVKRRADAVEINDIDRTTHHSLLNKLNAIKNAKGGIFGVLPSIEFNDKQFYSFEFNQLKEDQSLLRIIFTFLFMMVYKKDIEYAVKMRETGGVMPQVMYIFEEARNFVYENKSITRMLEKAVFEGRKFQIHAIFIAQQVNHIPLNIIKGCSTFMFLMPRSRERRAIIADDIKELFPNQKVVDFLLKYIPFRNLGIISSQGVSSCRLEITEKELKTFAN